MSPRSRGRKHNNHKWKIFQNCHTWSRAEARRPSRNNKTGKGGKGGKRRRWMWLIWYSQAARKTTIDWLKLSKCSREIKNQFPFAFVMMGTKMKINRQTMTSPIIIFSLQFLQYMSRSSSVALSLNWWACSLLRVGYISGIMISFTGLPAESGWSAFSECPRSPRIGSIVRGKVPRSGCPECLLFSRCPSGFRTLCRFPWPCPWSAS